LTKKFITNLSCNSHCSYNHIATTFYGAHFLEHMFENGVLNLAN